MFHFPVFYNVKSSLSYLLKLDVFILRGIRLQGSYRNLRHALSTRTIPRLTQRDSFSFRRVACMQYAQLWGIFFRNSIIITSSVIFFIIHYLSRKSYNFFLAVEKSVFQNDYGNTTCRYPQRHNKSMFRGKEDVLRCPGHYETDANLQDFSREI